MTNYQKIAELIKESYKKAEKNRRHYIFFGHVDVFIKDLLPENVDLIKVLSELENNIPSFYLHDVDAIYVGDFQDLKDRAISAKYADGAIYLSNDQENNKDIKDDLVHEIGHAVENLYGREIYSDNEIENEFLRKRVKLKQILNFAGYKSVTTYNFEDLDYSRKLDLFFYKKIGYEKLRSLMIGLFMSPYAATSIKEYFADGFEEYYIGDRRLFKKISPALFNKLEFINNLQGDKFYGNQS